MSRILITANRLRLSALLEKGFQRQGWETRVANDANDISESLEHWSPDLVLLDADWFRSETCALVTLIRPQSPVILTAVDYQIDGCDLQEISDERDIFIKPFSTKHLISVIRQILALRDVAPLTAA